MSGQGRTGGKVAETGGEEPALADAALEDALVRIRELSGRLWEVRRVHAPVAARSLLGGPRVRCAACGSACPCPTLRAVDAA